MTTLSRRQLLAGTAALAVPALLGPVAGGAEPASKPIQIGQIGVGHAHASKLGVYRKSAGYEVVGVVEPDAKLRQEAESQPAFQGVRWLTQDELLGNPDVQAVLVETDVPQLLSTAEACLKAGKHVHLDKPAGSSLPHFHRCLQLAAEKKLLLQMGYMYRYNPGIVRLREMLKNGWLGDVFEVHTVMSKVVPPAQRRELAAYQGGMMFELGCHVIDLVVGILGKPQSVTAFPQHASSLDDGLQDNMLAVLQYPRATATIKTSAMEVDGGARRHLLVCGTEGTYQVQPLDDPRAHWTAGKARGDFKAGHHELTFPKYNRYVDDAEDMRKILLGEKTADFSYEHDLAVQETVLRAGAMPLT